ncbi:MAG: hypothetical protein ABJB98_05545 [Actinomycetota bacterium]
MITGIIALAGVLVGAGLTVLAAWLTDRRYANRHEHRRMLADKQAAYHRVLRELDQLLMMPRDHPDLGLQVRSLTAQITELQLIAPPALSELAGQCVAVALQSSTDPYWAAQLRGQFALAARTDLNPAEGRQVTNAVVTRRGARHAVARRAR